jgi:hypothetical protein
MNVKLTGILTDVFPTETFPSGFAKRVFWLKQPDVERYPQQWEIELHGQDVTQIDRHEVGDTLEAEVEVRGKKWVKAGRQGVFMSLKCTGLREIHKLVPKPRQGDLPLQ